MASLKEIQAAMDESRKSSLRERVRPRGDSGALQDIGTGIRSGLAQFPADVTSMAEVGLGRDLGSAQLRESMTSPPQSGGLESFLRAPEPVPDTVSGRFGEQVGRSLPYVALAAPVALGSAGSLPAAATEIGADLLGVTVGAAAIGLNSSDAGALGAEVLTAAMTPGVAVRNAAQSAAERGVRSAGRRRRREIASMTVDPADVAVRDAESAARIAADYGLDVKSVEKAISEAKRRMGRDPRGGEAIIDRAVDEVESVIADFPDADSRPGTVAAMGDLANENFAGMQKSLSRADMDFSADMDGIRQTVQADLAEEWDRLLPRGGMEGARRNFTEIEQVLEAEEALAWERVPPGESILIDTQPLKDAAELSKKRAAGFAGRVPDEVRVIENLPEQIPLDQFQAIRSNALMTGRVARRGGEVSQFKANNLNPILDALNGQLDSLPEGVGSEAYRRALSLTRRNKELLAPDSPYVVAFGEMSQSHRAVRKILGAKDPAAEARKAVEFFSNSPDGEGLANLRAVFVESAFGEDLSQVTPRRVMIEIRKNRGAFEEVFGKEMLDEFEKLIRKTQTARRTSAGTAGATFQTGSNVNPFVEALFSTAEAAVDPVQSVARRSIRRMLSRDIKSNTDVSFVLREMLKDPELFVRMMQSDDDRAVAKWVVNWNVINSRAKTAARLGRAATRAPSRQGGGNTQ